MIITDDFLNIEGYKLEVRIIQYSNTSKLPSIVLLHEGLGSISLWKDWPERLAKKIKRNIIIYSRIGMGKSTPINKKRNTNFMHEEARKFLKKVIENYCTIEPDLFGHSDGASISIIYAGLNYPLNSLIVEAPHLMVEKITIDEITKLKSLWQKSDVRKKLEKYHDDVEGAFNGWCKVWLSDDFRKWNIEDSVSKIKVPLLAIQGTNDQYGTIKHIDIIEKNIKTNFSKVIISNCKHSPHHEYPELVLDKTAHFLLNN